MAHSAKPIEQWRNAMCRAGYDRPGYAGVFHFSKLANPAGDRKAAEQAYKDLLAECPEHKEALEGIAYLLQLQGRSSEAVEYRRRRLRLHARDLGLPADAQRDAAHYLLSAEFGDPPLKAPDAYVEGLFDSYASTFDEHLVGKLAYQVPALLLSQFREHAPRDGPGCDVLDVGCGTGLAGLAFESLAARLDGCDLSHRMLAVARSRGIYDDLSHGEIVDLLVRCERRYDVVVAADVLPYFGELVALFKAIASVLNDGGEFLFSVEKGKSCFSLQGSGRYRHSGAYLRSCASESGFSVLSLQQGEIRKQLGQPVIGYLGLLRRN